MKTIYHLVTLISAAFIKTQQLNLLKFDQVQNRNPNFNPNSSNQISNNYHNYSQELSENQYQVDIYNKHHSTYRKKPYQNNSYHNKPYQNNSYQNNFNQNPNPNQNNQFDSSYSLIPLIDKLSKSDKVSSLISNMSFFIPSLSGEEGGGIFTRLIARIRNKRSKKDKFEDIDTQSESGSCSCSGIIDIDYHCVLYTDGYKEAYKNKCLAECEREVEDVKSISSGKCGKNKEQLDILNLITNHNKKGIVKENIKESK